MYIGVDLGTSGVKVILVNEKGEILNTVSKEYPLLIPKPMFSEQNPKDWLDKTVEAICELTKDVKIVNGVSFSGQMHGLVVLDEDDKVIRPAILWNDQRTEKQCDFLNNEIGKEFLLKHTGNIALTGFTAPKLLWLKENEPENFNRISKIMLPKDYIAYSLSGVFASDVSDSSGTLYFDCKNKCWSKEMLEILNVDLSQLPKVYESYEAVGKMKDKYVKEFALENSPKIVIGGGDQAMGAIGTGTVKNGEASLALGTSGVMFVSLEDFNIDKEYGIHSFAHANGKYHMMSVMLNATGSISWFFENILKRKDFDVITSEAKKISNDNNLFFLPYLTGERTPINDPNAKGAFIGLGLEHSEVNMFLAVLEGVAFAFRDSYEVFKKLGINIHKLRITGGGSANDLWVQIISNVLNTEIEYINTSEGGALGACILSSVACGQFDTIPEACDFFIKATKNVYPNKEEVEIYNNKYNKFKKIYPTIKSLF